MPLLHNSNMQSWRKTRLLGLDLITESFSWIQSQKSAIRVKVKGSWTDRWKTSLRTENTDSLGVGAPLETLPPVFMSSAGADGCTNSSKYVLHVSLWLHILQPVHTFKHTQKEPRVMKSTMTFLGCYLLTRLCLKPPNKEAVWRQTGCPGYRLWDMLFLYKHVCDRVIVWSYDVIKCSSMLLHTLSKCNWKVNIASRSFSLFHDVNVLFIS